MAGKIRSGARDRVRGYLDGQMLVAMPTMRDERFSRTVIYLCAHSADGAMGIVVNQSAADLAFSDLLVQLDIIPEARKIMLPPRVDSIRVLRGGPVETGRGFVLHSSDFYIQDATLDILKALAIGEGPSSAVLALGYAGWAAGQLENEIQANGWLHCPADPDLIFGADVETKYERAMRKIGIDPGMLSSESGHA